MGATGYQEASGLCPIPFSTSPNLQDDGIRVVLGEVCERWICHDGVALMNGISSFTQETPQWAPSLLAMWGYPKKMAA